MLSCGTLAAWVECQDENGVWSTLPEYRVTNPDTKTTSSFIESKAGSLFRVKYYEMCKMAQYDAVVRVYVDGKEVSSYIYGRARPCGPHICSIVEGVRPDATSLLPFKFAKVSDLCRAEAQATAARGSIS